MLINDLSYLEEVAKDVNGGFVSDYSKVYYDEKFKVYKDVYANVFINGHVAAAEADADAYGYGSLAQGITKTSTSPYGSSAKSSSVSATSGYFIIW